LNDGELTTTRPPYVAAPNGAAWLESHGVGPFVTGASYVGPGAVVTWDSRAHRKHANRLDTGHGSTWWAPGAVAWWIGVLFMFGSLCFALGALPGFVSAVGVDADNATFFLGSLFFTTAAGLQYLETVNASPVAGERHPGDRVRLITWEPHRIDWWASAVQLIGTLCFNVSTLAAWLSGLGAEHAARWVWRPDAYGSVCFLVASALAWAEVGHRWVSWQPRRISWWVAALNLGGSIAFGVSAVAAHVVPDSGQPRNVELVNLGTFVGALGFLIGAFLLLPERTRSTDPVLIPNS
jgi:energy-converting hydrogenase Eha subunit A